MAPDFRFPAPDGTGVCLRVGLLCLRGERLLVCRDNPGFLYLPGGAMRVGEPSLSAAQREWKEETGDSTAQFSLVAVTERFFEFGKRRWHATEFFYRVGAQMLPRLPATALDNPACSLEWLSLDELDRVTLYPECVPQLLQVPDGEVRHFMVDERTV